MPDIDDMELDARPSWTEIYSNPNVCEEHGDEHVRNIIVHYKDLQTNQTDRVVVKLLLPYHDLDCDQLIPSYIQLI